MMYPFSLIRIVCTVILALVVVACLVSCGSDQRDGDMREAVKTSFLSGSIGACLMNRGARPAKSISNLHFLDEAEANDEVSKPGFGYDRREKIVVSVWSQPPFEAAPPQWIVWVAQPFGESMSPFEIVRKKPSRTYVMFVNHPSRSVRRRLEGCIQF